MTGQPSRSLAEQRAWSALLRLGEQRRRGGTPIPSQLRWRLADLYQAFACSGGVIAQLGQSLDGRIATTTGHSHYVTGPDNLDHVHRLRALADAVVVGAGTVAIDDPRLTTRRVEGPNPVRVVVDPRGSLPSDRRVFRDGLARTLHAVDRSAPSARGAERLELDFNATDPLAALLDALRHAGLAAVFVEGGSATVSRFLDARLLDRLHLCVAPVIIGAGTPSLRLPPIARMDEALRPPCRTYQMGSDILFDLDFRAMA